MWTLREQITEWWKAIPVLGFWRCTYHTFLYRWHARLAHKLGFHVWQGLGVKGVSADNPQGFAPYFEKCSWCGKVKE